MLPTNLLTFATTAAGGAFESIASVTAAGGEGSLTFSSIPSTYQHLQIRGIARTSRALTGSDSMLIRFNSDTGSNYAAHAMNGDGSSVTVNGSATRSSILLLNGATIMASSTANAFGANIIDIHDYANTSKNTTVRAFYGADGNAASSSFIIGFSSGVYFVTTAVTSISLINGFNFEANTTFALYGIKAA